MSSHDGQHVVVDGVEYTGEIAPVYNVRVADYHTYFVGCQEWGFSVWARNVCYWVIGESMDLRVKPFVAHFNAVKNPDDSARNIDDQNIPGWSLPKNNAWMGGRIAAGVSFLSIGRDPDHPVPRVPDYFGSEMTMLEAAHYNRSYSGNWIVNPTETGPAYKYVPPV